MIAGWERTRKALASGNINVEAIRSRIEACDMEIDLLIEEEIEITDVAPYGVGG